MAAGPISVTLDAEMSTGGALVVADAVRIVATRSEDVASYGARLDIRNFDKWDAQRMNDLIVRPGSADSPFRNRFNGRNDVADRDATVVPEANEQQVTVATLTVRHGLLGEREYRARRQPMMVDNATQDVLAVEAAFATWAVRCMA